MKTPFLIKYPYLFIIVIGLIVYARLLSFGYTYFDDQKLIVEDRAFLEDPSNIPGAFYRDALNGTEGRGVFYRPVLTISFMLDAFAGGTSPFYYHLTNLILHLAASCLVFVFLKRLKRTDAAALFFSVIFAVHPALTQAVAWIPGRNDILLAIFSLLSFIYLLGYLDGKGFGRYAAHIFFLIIALFTKESAVFLPLICFVYLCMIPEKKVFFRRAGALASGWIFAVLLWLIFRKIGLPDPLGLDIFYTARHLLMNLPALVQYLGKAVLPVNLSVWPIIRDTTFIPGIISISLISAAVWFSKKADDRLVAFGALWFLLFLLPSLVRLPLAKEAVFSEHRLYLPVIGIMVLLSETDFINKLFLNNRGSIIAASIPVIVFSAIAFCRSGDFRDRRAFFVSAVKSSPHSAVAHASLGYVYLADGSLDKAEEDFKTAIHLAPEASFGYNYMGAFYMEKKMFPQAEREFRKAIAIDPDSKDIRHNLANAYFKEGKLKEAERLFKR